MRSRWKLIIIAVILIAACLGGYWWYSIQPEEVQAPQISTSRVIKGDLNVVVSGSGTVSAKNTANAKVLESGDIATVNFEVGDIVQQGQVLATLEKEDLSSQIEQQELQIQKNALSFETLKTKYIEADEDSRASIASDIESMKLEMALAENELQELIEEQAKEITITAPITGTVKSTTLSVGSQVQKGAEVVEIVDYTQLQATISVDEMDIPSVKVNQKAELTFDALSDTTIEGTVIEIANEGSYSGGVSAFDVTILLNSNEGVLSGMSVQASIDVNSKSDILMVPIEAVTQRGDKSYVTLISGDADSRPAADASLPNGSETPSSDASESDQSDNTQPSSEQGQSSSTDNASADNKEPSSSSENTGRPNVANSGSQSQANGVETEVEIGINNETYIEIVSGVSEGDMVVLPVTQASSSSSSESQMGSMGGMGSMGSMGNMGGFSGSGGMPSGGPGGGGR